MSDTIPPADTRKAAGGILRWRNHMQNITPKHLTLMLVCGRKLGKRMTEVTECGVDDEGDETLSLTYVYDGGKAETRTYKMEGNKVKKLEVAGVREAAE